MRAVMIKQAKIPFLHTPRSPDLGEIPEPQNHKLRQYRVVEGQLAHPAYERQLVDFY